MGRIIVIEDNPVFAGYVCGLLEREALKPTNPHNATQYQAPLKTKELAILAIL